MATNILQIDGAVQKPAVLSFDDLAAVENDFQIPDVSTLEANRKGTAVRLDAVLNRVEPDPAATHITLHGSRDGFSANLPLNDVREIGLLIYAIDGRPLTDEEGGPLRFLIPNAAACKTAELDTCANVKFLDRIELTVGAKPDSRV